MTLILLQLSIDIKERLAQPLLLSFLFDLVLLLFEDVSVVVAAIHCYLTTAMAVEYTEDRFVIVFKELKIDEMCIFLQN